MKNLIESFIVFGIMTGLLLPARLLFVEYVSDSWLGSLGVISAISFSVLLLAKKNKLGFFGTMLERQIYKFQRGKRGLIVFGESVFLLLILGIMIFAIDYGNTIHADFQKLPVLDTESPEQLLETTKNWNVYDWFVGFLMIPVAFLYAFPEMSVAIASIDQKLDGWLMHFYTVGFVEYLELLGILILYRVKFRQKPSSLVSDVLYSKAAI